MTTLSDLHNDITRCQDCGLAMTRTKVVPGEGNAKAEIVFIGEGPGFHEDQQGRPFVGPAGKFLDELLQSIGLDRSKVFIGNVIKCRPPSNRDPLPQEIEACGKWLDQQIELISPKVIVTLGRYSMARFFKGASIGKIHGTAQSIDGKLCFAMYHPAAALHQQSLRKTIEADMLKLPQVLAQIKDTADPAEPEPEPEAEPEPKQLSMF